MAVAFTVFYNWAPIRDMVQRIDQGRVRSVRMALFDRPKIKIIYVTYQVICSMNIVLDVVFPKIVQDVLDFLGAFSPK